MFAYVGGRGRVQVAFTDRHGGVSEGTFASLNLADLADRGDDPAALRENHRRVLAAFTGRPDPPAARMRQVHGSGVVLLDAAPRTPPQADALVTRSPDLTLLARVADCVPVLLGGPDGRAVAAVHCGRRGLVAGIVAASVRAVREAGEARVLAWVGPHVCGGCYEVPEEMRDDVAGAVPQARATTTWGTPSLDLGAAVRAQLLDAEVGADDLAVVGTCTRESQDMHSHRRDGAGAGRLGALVRIRP